MEAASNCLLYYAKVAYRDPAGIHAGHLLEWAKYFIKETAKLRRRYRYLALAFDGYGMHVTYIALILLFRRQNVILVSLTAHSSHFTQTLEYKTFASFKVHTREVIHWWLVYFSSL